MGVGMDTRKQLITLLASNKNTYVSGQKLSDELNISRAAIWKHMKALEEDGYKIEAVTRKGYRIVQAPDEMSENTIQWGLETTWLGQHLIFEKTLDSTQITAQKLALDGAVNGTVVVADEQVKGRGRLQREWHSKQNVGIWMSMILRPKIEPYRAPQLTLLTAVAITRMLKNICNLDAKIKWPNDIYIQDKKLAGVLTEMQAEQDQISFVIIGIGINVNHDSKDLPSELQSKATSLKLVTNQSWQRETLIQELWKQIEIVYEIFRNEGFSPIKKEWEQSAYKLGEAIHVTTGKTQWKAELLGIHDDGALLVKDEKGETKRLYSAEIDWKRTVQKNANTYETAENETK
ncbi:biotin--[acetyl-CoA-carboxylase] ligase [Salirhabdus sp. Marseille-P4669]|uniref:biotin--[acetyl-CoA-carboxylase] ligase n=1 Tax=Salirhabdus sp. Marseille-P4669 TaxID=2042310 RepID=UPI001F3EDB38|nr:biotin--[acetyl-CoA-carboxylase] ligase [Salirhabdus sp. Marseille-P4669]